MRLTFILKRVVMGVGLAVGAMVLLAGGFMLWYFNRPLPPAIDKHPLFEGITYTRIVKTDPVPQIIHIAEIDLTADGLAFMVTPSGTLDNFDFTGQTTSQFLSAHKLQLAINGDFFDPWKDYGIFNYYPHVKQAGLLYGLVEAHPALNSDVEIRLKDLMTLLESEFDKEVIWKAVAHGRKRSVDDVVPKLLE